MLKLTPEQTDSLFAEVRSSNLSEEYKDWIILGIQSLFWMGAAYQDKKHKLFRFMSKIFGPKTEQIRPKKGKGGRQKDKGGQANPGSSQNANPNANPSQSESANDLNQGTSSDPSNEKPKGHGRRSADAFKKATCIQIALDNLKAGDRCPKCPKGTLYRYPPGKILVLMGQAPISAIHLKLQALRCGTCGVIFKATIPKVFATQSRGTSEAKATATILKYKGGVPFNRMEMLQKTFGTRTPKSEIWEMVEFVAESLMPIYSQLCREAAKAEVLGVDDTTMTILDLKKENEEKFFKKETSKSAGSSKKASKDDNRTGMFTTGILTEGLDHNITLYFTGRRHGGENLDKLLDKRPEGLPIPIEACDALARNIPANHKTQIGYCNSHNRRKFFDLLKLWPNEAMHVLDLYSGVFYNEKLSLEEKMSWEDRQKYHEEKSGPIMREIKRFCDALLESRKIEPNDIFGKAIAYQNKHWEGLTLFLCVPGVPLTTNSVERALKAVIRNRKNSLFYKTEWGAQVGDINHSIIETCIRNNIEPMDYLVACQICSEEVRKDPYLWLPWNFISNPFYITAKTERDADLEDFYQQAFRTKKAPDIQSKSDCYNTDSIINGYREKVACC